MRFREKLSIMVGAALLFCGGVEFALADRVQVQTGPMYIQESETRTSGKTVITGPGGTRTIQQSDSSKDAEILNTRTVDSTSDVEVSGVSNPGIKVERKVYLMPTGQIVSGNGPTDAQTGRITTISGGPGSVHSESHSTTTRTPPVRVIFK